MGRAAVFGLRGSTSSGLLSGPLSGPLPGPLSGPPRRGSLGREALRPDYLAERFPGRFGAPGVGLAERSKSPRPSRARA